VFHPSSTRSERGSVITTAMPIVIRLIRQLQQTSGSRTNSNPCCQLVNQEVLFGPKYPQLRLCTTAFLPEKSFLISSFDKEIKKKSISYSSKERQVFASLIKSNSAVSVLAQPQFDPQSRQCCFYTEKKTLHWIATAFIMFI
jgi:hypothetical protein